MQHGAAFHTVARRVAIAACATVLWTALPLPGQSVRRQSGTLERIRERGRITLGYPSDARPFSYRDESGLPAGYSVALCREIVAALRADPAVAAAADEWVPVTLNDRFPAVQAGHVDLLCGAETVTLSRRRAVSFSIPIFPGGIGVLVRGDTPASLREVLSGRGRPFHPTWRASATQVLQARTFSAIEGTTTDKWLADRLADLEVSAKVSMVSSYDAGVRALLDRRSDAVFGERASLWEAAKRLASPGDLVVVDRLFTYEPLALALQRGDEDFRLLVDRVLTRIYGSADIHRLHTKWFGEPDASTLTFFRWNTLPE